MTMISAARALLDSLQSGDLEQAEENMKNLHALVSSPAAECDMQAAAALMLQARKIAIAHRAQTAEALRALACQRHYAPERWPNKPIFQVLG